jgi:hypothetical protein
MSTSNNVVDTLNKAAEANDLEGIRTYSKQVALLFVADYTDRAYVRLFADRLNEAEVMARHGELALVSEEQIANSFNDIMKRVGAPGSLRTNPETVHRYRNAILQGGNATRLISVKSNGHNSNPAEAVFLLYLLIFNNAAFNNAIPTGQTPVSNPHITLIQHQKSDPNVRNLLSTYSKSHSKSELSGLFNTVANELNF